MGFFPLRAGKRTRRLQMRFRREVQPAEQWGTAAAGQSLPKGLLLTLPKCMMVLHTMLIPSPPGKHLWPCKSFYTMQDLDTC